MKLKEVLSQPIGALAGAALANKPELHRLTPRNTELLYEFAKANGLDLQDILCAVANWLGSMCDEADESEPPQISKLIN